MVCPKHAIPFPTKFHNGRTEKIFIKIVDYVLLISRKLTVGILYWQKFKFTAWKILLLARGKFGEKRTNMKNIVLRNVFCFIFICFYVQSRKYNIRRTI